MGLRAWWLIPLLVWPAQAGETWTWWVQECTSAVAAQTGCDSRDPELARWALEAWQRESAGAIQMKKSDSEDAARIRIRWASGASNLYGEAQPIMVEGKQGANIYVLPDLHALGGQIEARGSGDRLFRDAVVYLTCLHESGHALGLRHTAKFADIMYSFQFGGDFVRYFERYRDSLKTRADIAKNSGISTADREALQ